jgi:hypothetical protein
MDFRALILAVVLLAAPWAIAADEQAFTNRSTELKDQGSTDARTIATLPEGAAVKVIARGGGWTKIESSGKSGWVRVFHLRFPVTTETSASSGNFFTGLGSALNLGGSRTRTASTATTGIRGLSPEDLKNASPDPAAQQRMRAFRADQPAAERFAKEGKLNAVSIEYDGGRR